MPTPTPSRYSRALSPSLSASSSHALTINQQQKLNVVTRLAIEGQAKQGKDGANIKMYLKLSLPMDSVSPGSTIQLFPEENVKILTSQVHPIDSNSVPYNFSSTTCPLLHNAARALNLPARSPHSYMTVFGIPASSSVRSSSSRSQSSPTNGILVPPLDDRYTGHILVSGYNVSYVLPKEFPPVDDTNSVTRTPSMYKGRRSSIGDRNSMQFMAAIDLWVPYVCRPPRAPYLLSIPTPRCLSNQIKLRIFPPTNPATSFASLSSAEDDAGSWDLTADPHVTRAASARPSRTTSYTHFADDESSDSSATAGLGEGCGIQGTFPSAERIRVRWASPMKTVNVPGSDGRRQVGVDNAKGEMTCTVLGREADGVVMNVEYKGTCKGIWFPGVATMLGMDVGLEAKGSKVDWLNADSSWSVSGGSGYTGFDVGAPSRNHSRQSSPEAPKLNVHPSTPGSRQPPSGIPTRYNSNSSTSSTTSLLRAPLPAQNVAEYSFEGSQTSSGLSETISSLGSMAPSTPNSESQSRIPSTNGDTATPTPAAPVTLHLNMNDLLPPSKNSFTFTISGTILVTPRARGRTSDHDAPDTEPLVLPRFTVLAARDESTSVLVRNDVDACTVEVYNASGDIRDAQTRKTVLQRGGLTRCGSDGGRIALRSLQPPARQEDAQTPQGRARTVSTNGNGHSHSRASSMNSLRPSYGVLSGRPRRDGPLMIPYVVATVTPLLTGDCPFPDAYAVRICLPAPAEAESDWLEFGLAQPNLSGSTATAATARPPRVEVASASLDGVPVRFETTAAVKQEDTGENFSQLDVPFEQLSGKEWVSWVRVHVGEVGGGQVVVDYIVRAHNQDDADTGRTRAKGKGKEKAYADMNVFLPSFSLPIGRLEVNVEQPAGFEITSLRSNLPHQHTLSSARRVLEYSLEELFYPRLSLRFDPISPPRTVTSTVYPTGHGSKWWFGETTISATSTEAASMDTPMPTFSGPTHPDPTHVEPASPAPTPTPSPAFQMPNSLLPIHDFPFPWPLHFKLPDLKVPRVSVDAVLNGVGLVWQVFRKVYHYPLDPP
ncbi:hypothetical protein PLICRDRAFT_91911 [Plicaturopsis crispa FD-325 SS-3]|nr:hypothetical protein PLICRDRAFT_91911 [Plicaturopsis crispa FD-325 SS-3]